MTEKKTYCGFVAIVGRPNVGKSSLINMLMDKKVVITADKPQTTRHTITAILHEDPYQICLVDTPGIHRLEAKALNRMMNQAALQALYDVDSIVWMTEAGVWTDEDENVWQHLRLLKVPVIWCLNKSDLKPDPQKTMERVQKLSQAFSFHAVIPCSVTRGTHIDTLKKSVIETLPESPYLYAPDQSSDRSARFHAAELIRERMMRELNEEVPYDLAVEMNVFEKQENLIRVEATLWVEREGQKGILIGKRGQRLKDLSTKIRQTMENVYGHKVYLRLYVRVVRGWSNSQRILRSLGYDPHDPRL